MDTVRANQLAAERAEVELITELETPIPDNNEDIEEQWKSLTKHLNGRPKSLNLL